MGTLLLAGALVLAQLGQSPGEIASKAGRVGIELRRTGGNLVVSSVSSGSSAETLGLKVGDQVLRIDVDNVTTKSAATAEAALRGVYMSNVTMTVLPRASMLPRTLDVKRDVRLYDVANAAQFDSTDIRNANATPEPEHSKKPIITATLTDFQKTGGDGSEEKIRAAFGKSPPDVATCVGALADLLPNNLDKFGATFTIKKDGLTYVKTDPPSGDLSSCLGRKSTGWKIPKPGKDPTVVQVFWSIERK